MNRSLAYDVKGWCPGALRPMQSGDGLIVRIRPRSATFSSQQLLLLADASRRFGNGHIDLTRRSNLQIRGVKETLLSQLHGVIARLGLLDDDADGEAVRNVMINPLAGIDPGEVLDVRNIGAELARSLACGKSIWVLPGKFGFVVDGGGALTLTGQHADVRLMAVDNAADVAVAVGLETQAGVDWLGSISPAAAAPAAIEIGLAFVRVALPLGQRRMRDLSAENLASIRSAIAPRLGPLPENPANAGPPTRRIGLLELGADRFAVGVAAPFGRIEADRLTKFIEAVAAHGVSEIRLSPWRALYVAAPSRQAGQSVLDAAASDGWIVDFRDPLLQVEACPGYPGCRSTTLDTRGDGRRLARILPQFGFAGTIHVSGCAKGCAKSGPSDLVLVGADGTYGIVHHGTSLDRPARSVAAADLTRNPGQIFEPGRGATHD